MLLTSQPRSYRPDDVPFRMLRLCGSTSVARIVRDVRSSTLQHIGQVGRCPDMYPLRLLIEGSAAIQRTLSCASKLSRKTG
ncbi:hypothetical protein D3C85_607600 [compost metagenome]